METLLGGRDAAVTYGVAAALAHAVAREERRDDEEKRSMRRIAMQAKVAVPIFGMTLQLCKPMSEIDELLAAEAADAGRKEERTERFRHA